MTIESDARRLSDLFASRRDSRREELSGVRHYATPRGLLPSVTSVLNETIPPERARRFELAAKRRTPEERELHSKRRVAAAERGTRLHEKVEAWARDPLALTTDYADDPWFASLVPFLTTTLKKVVAVEVPIWHSMGYAGTADAVGIIEPGVLAVIDWKTSEAAKPRHRIMDYELQVAAYARAVCEMAGSERIVSSAVIVMALPAAPAAVYLMSRRDCLRAFSQFENRLKNFKFKQAQTRREDDADIYALAEEL